MSNLKCPFCQQELVEIQFGEQRYWSCINDRCNESVGFGGNLKLWQELIRTRKALGVAVDTLKELKPQKAKGGGYWAVKSTDAIKLINTALKQITALEQKE